MRGITVGSYAFLKEPEGKYNMILVTFADRDYVTGMFPDGRRETFLRCELL